MILRYSFTFLFFTTYLNDSLSAQKLNFDALMKSKVRKVDVEAGYKLETSQKKLLRAQIEDKIAYI